MTESERNPERTNGDARNVYAPALRAVAHTADEIRRIDRQLIERVRERPLAAMGLALAAGYVIGRLFSRFG